MDKRCTEYYHIIEQQALKQRALEDQCAAYHDTISGLELENTVLYEQVQGLNNFTNEMLTDLNLRVTRFEVIDHTDSLAGRVFVKLGVKVEFSYQDNGKTLKVILKESE